MAETVVVGCKLPQGLIITIGRRGTPQDKGTRDAQLVIDNPGVQLRLFGSYAPGAVEGFGMTPNVDKAAFTGWLKEHADWAPVKNGLVFCEDKMEDAIAHATAFGLVPNGFEPLDFENPMGDNSIKPDEKTPKPGGK